MGQEDWTGNEVQSGVISAVRCQPPARLLGVHDATQGSVQISLADGSDASLSVSRSKCVAHEDFPLLLPSTRVNSAEGWHAAVPPSRGASPP
eukprot:2463175-Rhodomonas_salina.1